MSEYFYLFRWIAFRVFFVQTKVFGGIHWYVYIYIYNTLQSTVYQYFSKSYFSFTQLIVSCLNNFMFSAVYIFLTDILNLIVINLLWIIRSIVWTILLKLKVLFVLRLNLLYTTYILNFNIYSMDVSNSIEENSGTNKTRFAYLNSINAK